MRLTRVRALLAGLAAIAAFGLTVSAGAAAAYGPQDTATTAAGCLPSGGGC